MNKKMLCILTTVLLISIFFSGCTSDDTPTTLFVDESIDSTVKGWNYDRFNSIQKAIDASENNTIIYVSQGVYDENIIIDKTVTIIGHDPLETRIIGTKNSNAITVQKQGKINISGFTIKFSGQRTDNSFEPAAISLYSNNNTVHGIIFENNSGGIYSEYSKYNDIFNNKFYNNYYGISLYTNSNKNGIKNNLFQNNRIGLRIKGSRNNEVSKNIFSNNVGGAYLCCGSIENRFFLNSFSDNTEFNAQDWSFNIWNSSNSGNFWDDYYLPSQGAFDRDDDGFIDKPYNISRGYQPEQYPNKDYHPRVDKPDVFNQFLNKK